MTPEDLQLADNFFVAHSGPFTIRVTWLPPMDPTGHWMCTVSMVGHPVPLEELRTKDTQKMFQWTKRQMKECARRTPRA
jgi:hypothetical protein